MFLYEEDGMLQMRTALAAIMALCLVLAACGGTVDIQVGKPSDTPAPTQAPTATPQVEPTSAPTATPATEPTPTEEPIDVAEHLSEKTMRLWDVYNMHDPDLLEEFYSPDYWQEEVDEIRSNMEPFKNLGLTFTAEETSPPTEIEPGKWELKHTARFQGGLVNMVFLYEEFDGNWQLTYAKPE